MTKKSRTQTAKLRSNELRAAVDTFVSMQKSNTFNYRQVSHAIGVEDAASQRQVAL